jgi:hypothetical protein
VRVVALVEVQIGERDPGVAHEHLHRGRAARRLRERGVLPDDVVGEEIGHRGRVVTVHAAR